MSSTTQKSKSITYSLGDWYHDLGTLKQQQVLDEWTETIRKELKNLSMHRCRVIGRKDGEAFLGNQLQLTKSFTMR